MFQRNKTDDKKPSTAKDENFAAPPLKPFSKKGSHVPPKLSAPSYHPDVARNIPGIPGLPKHFSANETEENESRKLVVGREICLSGKITSCNILVVEGEVEATLTDAHLINVADTGLFKGTATVDDAEISGRFEGDLTARNILTVHAGGQVSGTIRYGRISIESGGEIRGDTQALSSTEGSN
jgi:cytoskeletal protein CcmA (bactofilin family)